VDTPDATRQAVSRLLAEAHCRTELAEQALEAGDQAKAHDEFGSARALLEVVCILTDPDPQQTPARHDTEPHRADTPALPAVPDTRERERLERFTGPGGLRELEFEDGTLCVRLRKGGIDTIEDLRLALKAGTIEHIVGIGAKRIAAITETLARHDRKHLSVVTDG
jgi:hypothetical protein